MNDKKNQTMIAMGLVIIVLGGTLFYASLKTSERRAQKNTISGTSSSGDWFQGAEYAKNLGLTFQSALPPTVGNNQEFFLAGSLGADMGLFSILRVRALKDGKEWETQLPIQDNKFQGNIPLNDGKGQYDISLELPQTGGGYKSLGKFSISNPLAKVLYRPSRFPAYYQRGFHFSEPALDSTEVNGKIQIKGMVKDMRHLDTLWIEVTNWDKNGLGQDTIFATPSPNGDFAAEVPLTLGPGNYTIYLHAPAFKPREAVDDQQLEPVIGINVHNR